MNKELTNLREKGTWQEVLTPANRKRIGSKWVLKIKRDAEGNIIKHKARLVAKGYSQVPGVDFEETYAPVGRTTSLRILLTAAASLDLEILQADVEGAYLNGNLDVDIYMEYPQGVTPKKGCNGLLLKKSLYGLKQSGRTWWIEMGNKLAKLGFNRLESDWGLWFGNRSKSWSMYAGCVIQIFLSLRLRVTFIPRIVLTSPISDSFQKPFSFFRSSCSSFLESPTMTKSST